MLYRRYHKNKKVEKSVPKKPAFSDFPKHTGGGWYELSTGEKVQGKDEAKEAEETLKEGE